MLKEVISIKKQGIKRQIVLMTLAVLLTLCICGTVSAEDLSSTGGNGSDVKSTVSDNQTNSTSSSSDTLWNIAAMVGVFVLGFGGMVLLFKMGHF